MSSLSICAVLLLAYFLLAGFLAVCLTVFSSQLSQEEEALGLHERGDVQTGWSVLLFLLMFGGVAAVSASSNWPWWYTLVTVAPIAVATILLAWRAGRGRV